MWSPILKIELLKEGRNIRLPLTIIFYNAILAFVMLLFMVFNAESFQEGYYYNTSSYLYQFLIISSIQIGVIFFVIPFYVTGMHSGEKESCMKDVVEVIPGLSNQYIIAKMLLVILVSGMIFISALPVTSLSCVYSGIGFAKIIRLGIMVLVFSFWSGAITIFFHTLRTQLKWPVVAAMLVQCVFMFGTIMGMEIIRNGAMLLTDAGTLPAEASWLCLFLLILNPLASYMGYYGNLTGNSGLMTVLCGHFGINGANKLFSLFFYKISTLMCLLIGCIFLFLATRNLGQKNKRG